MIMWLSSFRGLKSPAVMMKDAGPRDEPWIILACMLANADISPPNFIYLIYKLRTQCHTHTIKAETVQNNNRHWRRPTHGMWSNVRDQPIEVGDPVMLHLEC